MIDNNRDKKLMKRIYQAGFSIFIFLVVWEIIKRTWFTDTSLFPHPMSVVTAFREIYYSGELSRDVKASLERALIGFFLGSIFAIATGLTTGRIKVVNSYLSPLIQIFRPLPPVAIIPLVIVLFKIGQVSKIFSIAFAVFFPVWINTHIGAQEINKVFIWSAHTLKVKGFSMLWKVILPAALPFVVAGLRAGIAVAFVMVYVSELAGASAGIGFQISISNEAYRGDRMIAAMILLGVFGAIADLLLTILIRLRFPWLNNSKQL